MRWLRNLTAISLCLVSFASMSGADKEQEAKDKARAALALAKAARERERAQSVLPKAPDLQTASDAAKKAKKPLIIWVNVEAKDKPEVFEKLKGPAMNFYMPSYDGNNKPRLIYTRGDGAIYYFDAKDLSVDVAKIIQASWTIKEAQSAIRSTDAIVQEK